MARLRIIIVNYRTPRLVIDCLRSLIPEVRAENNARVIVVDNDSRDGSTAAIEHVIASEHWEECVEVLPRDRNLGFAAGNNAALDYVLRSPSPPDYVLLLNPDTVVHRGALRVLVDFMEQHPKVGIAGSRLEDPDGTPQRSACRFPTMTSELEGGLRLGLVSRLFHGRVVAPPMRDEPHTIDWVVGASMIIRRAVFQDIGLFDDAFFLYFEEVDFCLRARRAGWSCWYVPASRVVHLVGQSSGVTDTKKPARRVPLYWFASRRRYFQKHHPWYYVQSANITWAVAFALWRLRRRLQRKPDTDPPHLLWDFICFNFLGASSPPRVESTHG
jgi:N-acetylglucosaminyl-diphospho-decaprenol L-rhamnosyltransferase